MLICAVSTKSYQTYYCSRFIPGLFNCLFGVWVKKKINKKSTTQKHTPCVLGNQQEGQQFDTLQLLFQNIAFMHYLLFPKAITGHLQWEMNLKLRCQQTSQLILPSGQDCRISPLFRASGVLTVKIWDHQGLFCWSGLEHLLLSPLLGAALWIKLKILPELKWVGTSLKGGGTWWWGLTLGTKENQKVSLRWDITHCLVLLLWRKELKRPSWGYCRTSDVADILWSCTLKKWKGTSSLTFFYHWSSTVCKDRHFLL